MTESMLVSFVICAYRQENYIEESVRSALAQTYEPLEIIISDDCSPDQTFEVVQRVLSSYEGKHEVVANRNETNLGLAGNINRAVALCQGELIVIQAGDDSSLPERTEKLVAAYRSRSPKPDLVFSNVLVVDSQGKLLMTQTNTYEIPTLEEVIRGRFFIAGGMACAYSRALFEFFGPLDALIVYEDYVLTFRALARNGIAHVPIPLVRYRVHDQSILAREKARIPSRQRAAEIATREIAQELDRFHAWQKSGRRNIVDRWLLKRRIAFQRADGVSSSASRIRALLCLLRAVLTLRPSFARVILTRDIFRLSRF